MKLSYLTNQREQLVLIKMIILPVGNFVKFLMNKFGAQWIHKLCQFKILKLNIPSKIN
jgi:hypothetical protein